jgi:hypothetical protein
MYINGQLITTSEELETAIVNMTSESQAAMRNIFNGVENVPPQPTQAELDLLKYKKRGEALPRMMAEMASENVGRIRSGLWTTNDLISLTQDVQIKEILSDLMALSFEIAYDKVDDITNPIVTSDIKTAWKTKLQNNFF